MICFMFPGQPFSRGCALPRDSDGAQVTGLVRRVARFDPESFAWLEGEGSHDLRLQLLGLAHSLYRLRALQRKGVRPELVAEHSMGIYPALVACGAVDEPSAVEITLRVGRALSGMKKGKRYGLGCVIGLQRDPVLAVAGRHGVHLANYNTSRHFLMAGEADRIAAAVSEALAQGAYAARAIDCDAPLHTPLLEQLEPVLKEIFADYRYAEPRSPLVDHLEQKSLRRSEIGEFLLRQLIRPVFWERSYLALRARGVTDFIEVGEGEALKKFNRWIESETAGPGLGGKAA